MKELSMDIVATRVNILMMTQYSLQSENFRQMLQEATGLSISSVDPTRKMDVASIPENSIVIIDISVSNLLEEIVKIVKESDKVVGTVLFNAEEDMSVEDVLSWKSLRGTFSARDSLPQVCQGLKAIANGDNWLPRKIINKLISYYELNINSSQDLGYLGTDLTRRELEILESLKTGGSNIEIADSLFVSEHTIKSHLYNIFKKLEVKNRTQAMAWARKHL
ncbi:helix-turn-helix transcriptional regulator [Vibrio sp. SCSIO 43135]|uniref:LuxR C-terminal-related transcriptional regulator n=1 Tax=Vibrio sp. SCSIO 43135 TaxID=2819096 RepID=UPI0020750DCC|nr:LuxR C-terminal-related transcriptional regulator [Vibrio sp. SCSIO 43135]USD43127.1 helix-turn-helix transcriptional regulator [Vibrio sp. SCSIO 43135]